MKEQEKTVDSYIAAFPNNIRTILQKLRRVIKQVAPDSEETISYQMPTIKLKGKYLVYFAAWKNHIGFYPLPSGAAAFKKELSKYKAAKGSVRFPLDEPIPYDLVKKIVRFRVQETKQPQNK